MQYNLKNIINRIQNLLHNLQIVNTTIPIMDRLNNILNKAICQI